MRCNVMARSIMALVLALTMIVGVLSVTSFNASALEQSLKWDIETKNAPWDGSLGFVDEDRSQGKNGYYSRHWMHGWNANGDYRRSMGRWAASGIDSRANRLSYDYTIGGYFGDFTRDL